MNPTTRGGRVAGASIVDDWPTGGAGNQRLQVSEDQEQGTSTGKAAQLSIATVRYKYGANLHFA